MPLDVAYYYPEPIFHWDEGKQLQPLVLFFDAVGLLVPTFAQDRVREHPYAGALDDHGLLKLISPETAVTETVAESIANVILELLTAGAFEELSGDDDFRWGPLSGSRIGLDADSVGAEYMCSVLVERGLARPSPDGEAYYLPRPLRLAYLLLLAQHHGEFAGIDDLRLHPSISTTGRYGIETGQSFMRLLDEPGMPTNSRATILGQDLTILDCDLSNVPLDEVLAYRAEHRDDFVRYRTNVRDMALKLSLIDDEDERQDARLDRERELLDAAHDLRRGMSRAWKTPKNAAGFGVGVAGASWALASTNPIGAAVAGLGALVSLLPGQQHQSAYTYIVRASQL